MGRLTVYERITIKEETKEEVATATDSRKDSVAERRVEETGSKETTKESEEETKTTTVTEHSRYRLGGGIVVRGLSENPDLEVSGSVRVLGPFSGRVSVELDGITYEFEGVSIGVEIEL